MLRYWSLAVAAALFVGCGCWTVKKQINVKTVEADIRGNLPIGSSKAEVIAFLDQRKIDHAWLRIVEAAPDGKLVVPNSHTERGIIRNVRKEGVVQISIQTDFRFDDTDSKLIGYSVVEVFKGP